MSSRPSLVFLTGKIMTRTEHIERHKMLHKMFDELMADCFRHTDMLPSKNSMLDLATWSFKQTTDPDEKPEEK